jgi:hypothetical protein
MLDTGLALMTLGISDGDVIPLVAIGGGLSVGVVGIVAGTISAVSSRKQREESRREIAAYVAEGSMSPDDAATLLSADMPAWEKGRCGK